MTKIPFSVRMQIYTNAMLQYGEKNQYIVAIEELSECQKEICKALRGQLNEDHLAEEVADATIMLEQIRMLFGINDLVDRKMDEKITRLDRKLRGVNLE